MTCIGSLRIKVVSKMSPEVVSYVMLDCVSTVDNNRSKTGK